MDKEIDLVIRARNKASGAIDEISKSLKELTADQGDLAKGAGKTSGALGGLAADVKKLQAETDRLKALGKIAVEMDKASAAVSRMQSNLRDSAGEFARLARESEQATQAATRLKTQLDAQESSLAENKASLREQRTELSGVNKLVRDAEAAQKRYNDALAKAPSARRSRGVGTDIGAPQTSARASAGVFVAAELEAARAQQARVVAEVRKYEQAVGGASTAIKELRPQVSAANSLQKSLADVTEKAANVLARERDGLGRARTELGTIQNVSTQAATALGKVALSQDQVTAASQRANVQLTALRERIAALQEAKTIKLVEVAPVDLNTTGDVGATIVAMNNLREAQERQRREMLETKREWQSAQAEVKRLAQAIASSGTVTEQQGQALGRAQAHAAELKNAYNAQRAALHSLNQSEAASVPVLERKARAAKDAANGIRQVGAASTTAAGQTRLFTGSLLDLQNGARQTLSLMQRLRGEVLALAAGYVGLQAAIANIGGAINAYRTLEAAQSRLGVVFNQDTSRVAQEINFLRAQADRLGIAFGTLANEYGKFAVAAQSANFTTDETRRVFLSIAEAGRVAKLSNEQLQGTFLALTQMMSKGRITAEELRGQLGERLTGAYNIFADAIGVTTAELSKMMEQGEVIADRSTFLKFADEMTERFGPQLASALNSVSTDIGRFENNIEQAQLTIANGFIPGLRDALQAFDAFAKSAEGQELFTNLGVAIGKFLVLLAEIPKYFDLISISIQAFIALKVAQILAGIISRMIESTRATAAFGRELTLIGPRTQAAAAAQGVLAVGMSQVVSTLGTYRQNLLATTAAAGSTRLSTLALAGAVGFLRTALIGATAIARGFLAAFGGPIGLAITAITLLAANWAERVDGVSVAIAEHDRQVRALQTAYREAGRGVDDWASKMEGVTVAQILANTEALRKSYQDATRALEAYSRQAVAWYADIIAAVPDDPRAVQAVKLNDLAKQFAERRIEIEAFQEALNDIALNAADDDLKNLALGMLDLLNRSDDSRQSIGELGETLERSEALLRLSMKTATEADKALFGMGETTEEVNETFDNSALVEKYTAAIDTLKGKIPGLTAELKKLKDMTEINQAAWEGMTAAFAAGDYGKIAQIIGLWAQAAGAVTNEANQKMLDAYPGAGKDIIERIIYVEGGQSGGGPSTSSARGIGQFTEGTWLRLFDRIFPELAELNDTQKLALRTNEEAARKMLEALTRENQSALVQAGVPVNAGNTYLAHFLGSGDAIKVLLANPNELAENIVQKQSVTANPSVFRPGMTAGDLIAWAGARMGGGSEVTSDGTTVQENFDADIQGRIDALREEATARGESNREAEIAKAIAQAENEARQQGVTLTQEQIVALREAVGAKYDSLHADEALKAQQEEAREILSQIVGLDQQRKLLLEEIQMAQNAGETEKAQQLIEQLATVNSQLDQMIPKAQEFARTLGDEKMVATLQKVSLNIAKAGQQFSLLGLSLNQWKGLATNFADGLVGAIDSFAQSIARGEDAVRGMAMAFMQFAADFLRQISQMILKQIVLNMLQTVFPGIGSLGMAHTGGLVGAAGTGSGNGRRQVAPMWFSNAMRYHTGGIAGLKPDEVPTILKQNEEVLTEDDPRHRFNRKPENGDAGSAQAQPIKQVLAIGEDEIANAIASSAGEKVVLTHIRRNASTLRHVLGT